jgi:hypothetical protein
MVIMHLTQGWLSSTIPVMVSAVNSISFFWAVLLCASLRLSQSLDETSVSVLHRPSSPSGVSFFVASVTYEKQRSH